MKKRKIDSILDFLTDVKIRIDRGLGLMSYLKYFAYGFGIKFTLENKIIELFVLGAGMGCFAYLLGWTDKRYGIWTREQQKIAKEVTGFKDHLFNGRKKRL